MEQGQSAVRRPLHKTGALDLAPGAWGEPPRSSATMQE